MSSLLFPVYKLSRENAQPENMCGIVFEKAKGGGGKVHRTSVYAQTAVARVQTKGVMRNFAESTKKHLSQNLFFDKVKL